MIRDVEKIRELQGIKNAHPADADPFAARGQPEILNRTDSGINRRLRHGLPSQSVAAPAGPVTKDAEVLRGFEDPLQFEPRIPLGLLTVIAVACPPVGCLEDLMDTVTNGVIPNQDKPGWL